MGTIKNLTDIEGIKKLKELAEGARMCHFITGLGERPLSSRPMSVLQVDEDGNLWFFSQRSSEKNAEISIDSEVQLFFSNNSSSEYLVVFGTAEIVTDQAMIDDLWSFYAKTWFNEGKEDPEITLLKVTPMDSHYWDTKNNKMIQLIKIAVGAIAGKQMDDGVEGKIIV